MKIRSAETKRLVNGRIIHVTPGRQTAVETISDSERLRRYKGEHRESAIDKGASPSDWAKRK